MYDKYCVNTKKREKTKYVKKKSVIPLNVKKKTNNKEIKGFNLENKIELQKSTCSVCDKKKSTSFKTSKKQKKWFSQDYKRMVYCSKCKSIPMKHVQKN